jgi:hypothetical protein
MILPNEFDRLCFDPNKLVSTGLTRVFAKQWLA